MNQSPARTIALQLYTVREEMKKDLRGTLEAVKDSGYDLVETAFWPEGTSIRDAGKLLNEIGLSVCSAHCALPVDNVLTEMREIADSFACRRMIWHGWPEDERYQTHSGIIELCDIYNETQRLAKDAGLQFGLHNHWWEFMRAIDGQLTYELMLELLNPDIFFELDVYWLKVAGHDPATVISRFGKRAPLLHVKDGPARWTPTLASQHEPQVALGQGVLDFSAIMEASANVECMVVEMDVCAGDVLQMVRESRTFAEQLVKN